MHRRLVHLLPAAARTATLELVSDPGPRPPVRLALDLLAVLTPPVACCRVDSPPVHPAMTFGLVPETPRGSAFSNALPLAVRLPPAESMRSLVRMLRHDASLFQNELANSKRSHWATV